MLFYVVAMVLQSMVTGSVEVKVESISMLGAATRVPFTPGTKGLKVR